MANNSKEWASALKFCLVNLGIILLVGFALYVTKIPWVFLGLFFLFSDKRPKTINTKCPKCDYEFVAVKKEEKEEEGE
ncbi:MAG: hypothetical protein HY452_02240 [Parcubacteria group bacterium]|nr:hypothetical protein [Parcubacteria group bacterium]